MTDEVWKVLVVDDEPDVHTVMKMSLKRRTWKGRTFNVVTASSATEARAILSNGAVFHVAIVDAIMETETAGLDLCRDIRANYPRAMRLILCTGQPSIASEAAVLQGHDIDVYIPKGEAKPDRIFAAVRACLLGTGDILALEEQTIGLEAETAKLQRECHRKGEIIRSLGTSEQGLLGSVLKNARTLSEMGPSLPAVGRQAAQAVLEASEGLVAAVAPTEFRERSVTTLQQRPIFVTSADPKIRNLLASALAGTGALVETFPTSAAMVERLGHTAPHILYVDWENSDHVATVVEKNPAVRVVLVVSRPVFEEHGEAIMKLPLSNLLISNVAERSEARDPLAVHEIIVTAGKLLTGDVFGIEKYLAWGTQIHTTQITSSSQRADVITQIADYARSCGVRSSAIRTRIQTLVDELTMNAIWDAPVDRATQTPKYASLSRRDPLTLLPDELVTVRYGSDGNLFVVSVTDQFGRLTSDLAFRYLLKCFKRGSEQIDDKPGGAGLGLYLAYLAVSSFVLNVKAGEKSEVIGMLNMHLSQRDLSSHVRSFQYFVST